MKEVTMLHHRSVAFPCCLAVGLWLLGDASLWAQGRSSANYLTEAFNRVTNNSDAAKYLVQYGYAEGTCIVGGWVESGSKMTFGLTLIGGKQYGFIAGGDQDAEDV